MQTALLFLHALSALHAGTGQGVGVIDLPIAREKATNLPYVPGSSVKGVLRDKCENADQDWKTLFGPKPLGEDIGDHAGAAIFSDQRLLLLPIRSLYGTFAWVTSPYVLRRFAREVQDVLPDAKLPDVPLLAGKDNMGKAAIAHEQKSALASDSKLYLEDLDLLADPNELVTKWAQTLGSYVFPDDEDWRTALTERLCVVPDNVFSFLLNTATEIIARIRLEDEKKTVVSGGLWYEESLPAETILSGLVAAHKVNGKAPEEVLTTVTGLAKGIVQIGGKATVGRGLCRLSMFPNSVK